MMKSVNVTFRVDEDIKDQADDLFSDLGMSLSTAFNIFETGDPRAADSVYSEPQYSKFCNSCCHGCR